MSRVKSYLDEREIEYPRNIQRHVRRLTKKTSVSFRKGDEGFLLANFEENLRKTLKFARRKPSSPFRKEIGVAKKDLQFVPSKGLYQTVWYFY
eukprot:scaffold74615_cov72-Cyclotella_meneghiniana.AAC.2